MKSACVSGHLLLYYACIGVSDSFGSGKRVDQIFADGERDDNYLGGRHVWVRVVDTEGTIHWLYDGRMTCHTDNSMFGFTPTHEAGTIIGKNGYNLVCDSAGYPTHITHYGSEEEYTAGNNWINVSTIRVYPDYFEKPSDYIYTANAAQVGITGTFGSSTNEILNMTRSTVTGENYLGNNTNVVVRVRDENETNFWFYCGRLTDFTDADMEK